MKFLHLPFNRKNPTFNTGTLADKLIVNNKQVELTKSIIAPNMQPVNTNTNSTVDTEWQFVTELDPTSPMNNPWTGEGEKHAPQVAVPLSSLSNDRGRDLEVKVEVDHYRDHWRLVTELARDDPVNNPWTGKGQANSPPVFIPLNQLSIGDYGRNLEIKIEWDHDSGKTSKRFFKNWRLHEVFDTARASNFTTNHTVSAKWKETDDWYSYLQAIGKSNQGWDWNFTYGAESEIGYTGTLTNKIGYNNVGFMLHGNHSTSAWEIAAMIYSGQDEHGGRYESYIAWTKVRVYVKFTSKIEDLIYSRSLVKPPTTTMPRQETTTKPQPVITRDGA